MPIKPIIELTALAAAALKAHGASEPMALTTAKYLVAADVQGLATHGVMRVASYCGHLAVQRAHGQPACRRAARSSVRKYGISSAELAAPVTTSQASGRNQRASNSASAMEHCRVTDHFPTHFGWMTCL